MIKVYSKNNCPFCTKAKALLEIKGIKYTEVNIEQDADARKRIVDAGLRTVPQIYINEQLLPGGYNGLADQTTEFFDKLKES
jgi:glutaredoxin|tara:strand:+ start:150 stop:395 length:246 start_codon:yes stop_codon:yes gene_type:complete